jgi:hypothetical protein
MAGDTRSAKNGSSKQIDPREDDIQKQLSLPGKQQIKSSPRDETSFTISLFSTTVEYRVKIYLRTITHQSKIESCMEVENIF